MSSFTAETHLYRARTAADSETAISEFIQAIDEVVRDLNGGTRETADNSAAAHTEEVLRRALRAA